MPRKGMRSVYFSTQNQRPISESSTPYSSPLRNRISIPIFSFSEPMMVETLTIAEQMINKWNPESSTYAKVTSLFYENRRAAKEFIKCVNNLQTLMHFLITENSSSEKIIRAQKLMQIAMKRLEKEFYQILSMNREHLDSESLSSRSSIASWRSQSMSSVSDYEDDARLEDEIQLAGNSIADVEQASKLAVSDLKSIADCMISSGYGKECVKIYKIIRKSIVDEALYNLGVERLNSNRIHKLDWEIIELKHQNWLKSVTIAVKTLFSSERFLSDQVFGTSNPIRESCFSEISREGAMNLFIFPELIVMKSKKSPDKIFRLLQLYTSISDLWHDIEFIFSFESTSPIRNQALSSLIALADAVRAMLSEFEASIHKDSSKSLVRGGGIHPLTQTAMDFICLLADYSGTLSNITAESPLPMIQTTQTTPVTESNFENPNSEANQTSAISIRFAWLILVLLCKLDGKSELYRDVPLSYLFLANNLNFVVTKVRRSNLQFLLGEDWICKHESKVKLYTDNYEKMAWSKVLSTVPQDPTVVISSEEAKSYFRGFVAAFEAAYRHQSSWIVTDNKLRDEIKVSICSKLMPIYRAFYGKYRGTLRNERDFDSLVKFSPDDLGNYLSDLFYGNVISGSSTPKKAVTMASMSGSSTPRRSVTMASSTPSRVGKLRLETMKRWFSF